MKLDTRLQYETPEGVVLHLPVAGIIARGAAQLLDILLVSVLNFLIVMVFGFLGWISGFGLLLIMIFLLQWGYPIMFEVMWGYTPGKRAMGLRVCHDDGTPIGFRASVIRNLLRTVDFLPFGYALGCISLLLRRDFKRLGDVAANTLVVYDPSVKKAAKNRALSSRRSAKVYDNTATPLPLPIRMSLHQQRAIADYAERQGQLSEERQIELAEVLTPVTKASGKSSRETVLGYANGIQKGLDS